MVMPHSKKLANWLIDEFIAAEEANGVYWSVAHYLQGYDDHLVPIGEWQTDIDSNHSPNKSYQPGRC